MIDLSNKERESIMFYGTKKVSEMGMWASYVTPHRFENIVALQAAEKLVAVKNRQMGNIVSDLRNAGEHKLIARIEREIEWYNDEVARHNEWVDKLEHAVSQFKQVRGVRSPRSATIEYMRSGAYETWSPRDWYFSPEVFY
jgi:hypothetical protein